MTTQPTTSTTPTISTSGPEPTGRRFRDRDGDLVTREDDGSWLLHYDVTGNAGTDDTRPLRIPSWEGVREYRTLLTPEPTTQPTTSTTPTDLKPGDRVRVTFEGTVRDDLTYLDIETSDRIAVNTATITVERVRPAVPTGLGAVVRLDGPDGPLASSIPSITLGAPVVWAYVDHGRAIRYEDGHRIACRIVDVLSPGIVLT